MSPYSNNITDRFADYSPQMEFSNEYEDASFDNPSRDQVLSDFEEMQLAAEFLDLSTEPAREQFLDGWVKALTSVADSTLGRAVTGVVKNAAKALLPQAGAALGSLVAPGVGSVVGRSFGSLLGNALEMEDMSPGQREFEASKQFVRFVAQTVENALKEDPDADPEAVAHRAAVEAARVHAPGLIDVLNLTAHGPARRAGNGTSEGKRRHRHFIDRTQVGFAQKACGRCEPFAGAPQFDEDHMRLASDLMELPDLNELEPFLDEALDRVLGGVQHVLDVPTRRALIEGLREVAERTLPEARHNGKGSEDPEWEAANTMVKVISTAANNAVEMPGVNPSGVAKEAILGALGVHAPEMAASFTGGSSTPQACSCHHAKGHGDERPGARHESGRWYRHGKNIILEGF